MQNRTYYERALGEIVRKECDKAIFAKAFSDAAGDEEKTKALYIRHRVKDLEDVEHQKRRMAEKLSQQKRSEEEHFRSLVVRRYEVQCPFCAEKIVAKASERGSTVLAIFLLFLFVIPGIVYIKNNCGYVYSCPKCRRKLLEGTQAP
jgi:hypothetical protein